MTPRERWLRHLERVARPVLEAGAEGALRQRMPLVHRSDCPPGRVAVAHAEAIARLLAGIAPWLAARDLPPPEESLRRELAGLATRALTIGFDPGHPARLELAGHQQALVEAAFLAQALARGRAVLWDGLEPRVQRCVLEAFAGLRDRSPPSNNWLLFGAMPEAFLAGAGERHDPLRIEAAISRHEQWYLGDGVYGDGPAFRADYYNSYVIQPMQRDVLALISSRDQKSARLLPRAERRLGRLAAILERLIHVDGSWPALGRSITYRLGAFHALAQAALLDLLPPELPPAQVRCALSAACDRSLAAPGTFDERGWLRIGLCGNQPGLGESYITTGSLYLTSLVFLPLGLGPAHPFWSGEDRPWTASRLWSAREDLPADSALRD